MSKNFWELINSLENKDKLEELISILQEKGILSREITEILENAINAVDTIVREIMIPRTKMIAVDYSVDFKSLIEIFDKYKYSRIPVYKDNIDNIVGLIYSKDILSYKINYEKFEIKKVIREPLFIPETKKILSLLKEFKDKKVHIAIVVDEFGGVSGMVTLIDIVEEIIGDFDDEFDIEENVNIVKLKEKVYLVDSRCPLEEIEEQLNIQLPEGPFDTIGGFITKEIGRIPEKDEVFDYETFKIKINQTYEKGIKNIILTIKNVT